MSRYLVIKGRNLTPGKSGCDYSIIDIVDFSDFLSKKDLETQMRKYVFRKLVDVDNKRAKDLRTDTWCRRRHILKYDGSILVSNIKIWDHESGIFHGFVPVDSFNK